MNVPIKPLGIIISLIILFFTSCENYHKNKSHLSISDKSIKAGKQLAMQYCGSCHQLPDPSLLDAKTWENGVLPAMGQRLGIFSHGFKQYPITVTNANSAKKIDPSQVVNFDEWQNILDYYGATSPDSLPPQKRKDTIKRGLSLFKLLLPKFSYKNSATSFVKINSKETLHPLIISDATKQNLYFFSRQLEITDSIHTAGPVVDIDFNNNNLLACNIGVLTPNNGKYGKAESVFIDKNGKLQKDSIAIIDSLQRPVQIAIADLNNDGKQDYLICEFGFLTGALSWMENLGNNKFKKHVLRNLPGAIKVYIKDYNHDGLPDIWALFAQGEEGIFLFTNKGNGEFSQEEVLRFPPVNGSSYFELADFNNDGYPDIIYTCGDNADYSPVLKPYHGVYIFMNDKTNHFTRKFFYPINGCYKAMARDFDGDGDLDIATIAFFADYIHQPEEGFVYFTNTGNLNFMPSTLPGAKIGRWLTMDAADYDGDGRTDIILGNFSIGPVMDKVNNDWKQAPPFIILKNMGL